MPVVDLQAWADNLEDLRLPGIDATNAQQTTDIAANTALINQRAQEITDVQALHDARITAAQTDADTAEAGVLSNTQAQTQLEIDLKAYTDASVGTLAALLAGNWGTSEASVQANVQAFAQGLIDAALPNLTAEKAAALAELAQIESDVNTIVSANDTAISDLLSVTLPGYQSQITNAQGDADQAQNDFNTFIGATQYATFDAGINAVRAENEAQIAPIGATILREPRTLWGIDVDQAYANIAKSTLGIYGSFHTDDTNFGEAFEYSNADPYALGQAYPIDFEAGRVYKITVRVKCVDDGTSSGADISIGAAVSMGTTHRANAFQTLGTKLAVADGVLVKSVYACTAAATLDAFGIDPADQIILTGASDANKLYAYVMQNEGSTTDGRIRVGSIERQDVTEVLTAVNQVREDFRAVSIEQQYFQIAYNAQGSSPQPSNSVQFKALTYGFTDPRYKWFLDTGSGFSEIGGATSQIYTYAAPFTISAADIHLLKVEVREGTTTGDADVEYSVSLGLFKDSELNSALQIHLSNPNPVITTNSAGTSPNLSATETQIHILGLSYTNGTVSPGFFKVTSVFFTNGTGAGDTTVTDSGSYGSLGDITSMTTDSLTRRIQLSGQDQLGQSFTATVDQVFSKSKQGVAGASGTSITNVTQSGDEITISYSSGSPDTFTVDGVSSVSSISGGYRINLLGGGSYDILNGDDGRGVSNISKSGETVTIDYDDGSDSTFTVSDGTDAVVGYVEWDTASNFTKDAAGDWSSSTISYHAVFVQGGVVVSKRKFGFSLNAGTGVINNHYAQSSAENLATSRQSEILVNGNTANAVGEITYSHGGITSKLSVPASVIEHGRGIASVSKSGSLVTTTFDDGSTDTFTVNGVSSVNKVGGTLTINYDDGGSSVLTDGDDGVGIASINKSGETVTVNYDDATSTQFTVPDGAAGVDATKGDADPLHPLIVNKDKSGVYSHSYIDVDMEFYTGTTLVSRERVRLARSNDTWGSVSYPSSGSNYNTTQQSSAVVVDGTAATLTATHTSTGSKINVPVNILIAGVDGETGPQGIEGDRVYVGRVYYNTLQASTPLSPNDGSISFNEATGLFSGLRAGWSSVQPQVEIQDTGNYEWSSAYRVTVFANGDPNTYYFSSPSPAQQVATDMESDNFSSGSAGWRLERDTGNLEVNDLVARGSVESFNFVQGSAGFKLWNNGAAEFSDVLIRDSATIETGALNLKSGKLFSDSGELSIAASGVDTDEISFDAVGEDIYKTSRVYTAGGGSLADIASITLPSSVMAKAKKIKVGVQIEQGYNGSGSSWEYELKRGSTVVTSRDPMVFGQDIIWIFWMEDAVGTSAQTWAIRWAGSDTNITSWITMYIEVNYR